MNIEEFETKLTSNGLGLFFDKIKPLLRNTIRFYLQSSEEDNIAVGQTKIGGRPDLPAGITWATETNIVETIEKKLLIFSSKKKEATTKPLSFIAQINLSETAPFDQDNLLPKSGLLYFFYFAEQEIWGYYPKDKNKFKVIYWDGDLAELKRADFPVDLLEDYRYNPCTVEVKSEVSPPSYGHKIYDDFAEEDVDKYWEEVYNDDNLNRLLGYADIIQNEMELECELVTKGLNLMDLSDYNDPRVKMLAPNAKNWLLLLQVDSNDKNNMMWGDCGRLYFWIKKEDLIGKRFDQSWFVLQWY
jgi:uncharacterized protein YwqG